MVHANAYQNQDLFWALRGGGGGTFGVVTSVTLRTFDEAPVVISSLNISTPTGSPDFWSAMTAFHASLPDLNGAGGSGYYTISPIPPVDGVGNLSVFRLALIFPDQTDPGKINDLHAPLLSKLGETNADIQYTALPFPSVGSSVQLLAQLSPNLGGVPATGGSRLFSRDLLASEEGPAKLVSALKRLKYEPGQLMEGIVVAGGAVAANGKTVDSAVNPAWRKTITHIGVGRLLGPTWEEQKATQDYFTNVAVPILKSVEGEDAMGAYVNEADPDERDFQSTFWGENYPRLYEIKQKWDPTRLFIARKGVGSEDWDDAGLCRVGK